MASVTESRVIFREWGKESGLEETERGFASLDELFRLCLQHGESPLVDRIIMEGTDDEGKARRVVLSFQSVTDSH